MRIAKLCAAGPILVLVLVLVLGLGLEARATEPLACTQPVDTSTGASGNCDGGGGTGGGGGKDNCTLVEVEETIEVDCGITTLGCKTKTVIKNKWVCN